MKLKLMVGLAVMAFGTAVHAQGSVTLYGAVDGGLLYQSTSAASFSLQQKISARSIGIRMQASIRASGV